MINPQAAKSLLTLRLKRKVRYEEEDTAVIQARKELAMMNIGMNIDIVNGMGNLQVSLDVPMPIPVLPLPMTHMGFPMKISPRSSKMERH